MIKVRVQYTFREVVLILLFYLFFLQKVLMEKFPVMGYLDEIVALIGVGFLCYRAVTLETVRVRKTEILLIGSVIMFVIVGILGNVIYHYQPIQPVLKDTFACLKFFFAMVAGTELFLSGELQERKHVLVWHGKLLVLVLFLMLLMDLVLGTYATNKVRYGLPVVQLIYTHPTYLASTAVFLLGVLTLFYQKNNIPYILMALLVMFFTLRSKAIAAVAIYGILFWRVMLNRKKFRFLNLVFIGAVALFLAWDQVSYYYLELTDESARAMLTQASFRVMNDHFPFGSGFGTFASNAAAETYSPVYFKYDLNIIYGLRENRTKFASDTFWPIIIGQTGFLGTCAYVTALGVILSRILKVRAYNHSAHLMGIFLMSYLLISSTSESAFCNPMAVPLGVLLGAVVMLERKCERESRSPLLAEGGA